MCVVCVCEDPGTGDLGTFQLTQIPWGGSRIQTPGPAGFRHRQCAAWSPPLTPSRWTPLWQLTVYSRLTLNQVGRFRWQLVGVLPCPGVGLLTSKLGISRMIELVYLQDSRGARPALRAEAGGSHSGH